MSRTEQCAVVNEAMLKWLQSDILDLPVSDTLDTVVDEHLLPKVEKVYQKLQQDTATTAGLDKCLRLCVGAKVTLKRNIGVEAGLVNDAVETVTGFDKKKTDGRIEAMIVDFQNVGQIAQIEKGVLHIRSTEIYLLHEKTISTDSGICYYNTQKPKT